MLVSLRTRIFCLNVITGISVGMVFNAMMYGVGEVSMCRISGDFYNNND